MVVRVLACLALTTIVWPGRTARAQSVPESDETKPPVTDEQDLPPKHKSYLVPTVEVLGGNALLFGIAAIVGKPWARTNPDVAEHHLDGGWEFDEDAYSTNNIGHPATGALAFSMARSTGHGFWVSSAYALGGSFAWEMFENDIPSTNDMITTPIGGAFIGEAMHRFSRALLYPGYGRPTWARKTAATIIDPIGAFNRATWGDAWTKTVPPAINAYFAVGWQQPTHAFGADHGGDGQLHVEAYVEHGLIGDRSFKPRRPLDHFTLQAALDTSRDDLEALLYVRGILVGSTLRGDTLRGMYGLFGGYDYNSNHYVRASMLGVGPGATAEVRVAERGYVAATAAAYLVPYGSAGGVNETVGPMRDHHDGPGLSQLIELQAGQRGLFGLRATVRAYEIDGRVVDDHANEFVVSSTVGGRAYLLPHHAIGIEGTYTVRRADYADPAMQMATPDRTTDVRVFYAITTDEILGR